MSVDGEVRQTCPLCNGTGEVPVRVATQIEDQRRKHILTEEANHHLAFAIIEIMTSKAKPSERLAEKFKRIASACEPYARMIR